MNGNNLESRVFIIFDATFGISLRKGPIDTESRDFQPFSRFFIS